METMALANESPEEAGLGLRERSRLERLRRIRAAAEELFNERGYEQTTTKEVAERAGVGEATLFRYVTTKHELLLLTIGENMNQAIDSIEAADLHTAPSSRTAADYIARVYAVFEERAKFFGADPENVTSYLHYGFRAGSQLGAQSVAQGDRIINLVSSILDSAADSGFFSPDVESRVVAQNCNGTYIHEVLRSPVRQFSADDFWERLQKRLSVQIEPLFTP
ncbi:TetR/AcrR family transcriptional regulator [Paeniglutamicibacter psychrophenolicus]|nr:TetR/AcrR family transcriptional regulator [Paeniglutamicibacter psychrophenolicus]